MIDREYEKLLTDEGGPLESVAANNYELLEYVYGLLTQEGADQSVLPGPPANSPGIVYHSHCQQRTLGLDEHTVAVLERMDYDVTTTDVECCGMAGSFGYKADYYEISMDVGEQLRQQLDEPGNDERIPVASGTSCLEQIDALLAREPTHPVELLDPDGGE